MSLAVVFGGAGFLGSHVADELTTNGFQVRERVDGLRTTEW